MSKMHFRISGAPKTACGILKRYTVGIDSARLIRVDCDACRRTNQFKAAETYLIEKAEHAPPLSSKGGD